MQPLYLTTALHRGNVVPPSYLSADTTVFQKLPSDAQTVRLVISRVDTLAAGEVTLKHTNDKFDVPSTVSFAAGEASKEVVIPFAIASGTNAADTITLTSEAYPYGAAVLVFDVTVPSGCVATAMAQIMYYHKYPLKGQGTHQYSFHPASGDNRLISADFGQTAYDWDEMLDDYASVKYTDAQAQAVSTLLLHCGVSVDMQYTASGSGASTEEAAYGLRTYFGYHGNIGCFYRDYYSLDDWMNMVYAELNKKRPILYATSDYYGSGGHAFVIDGYDAQGRVHVNWGWGARGGNGYFDIGLLNPSGSQYSENQRMVLGIARPEEDIEYQSHIVSPNAFIVVKAGNKLLVTPGSTMYNLCGETWSGRLGLILEGNGQTWVLQEKTVTGASFRYNVIGKVDGNFGGLVALPEGIANGAYRLYAASRDERDRSWRLVRRSEGQTNSYLVTIVDGSPSSVEADGSDVWTALPAPVRQHTDNRLYEVDGLPVRQPVEGRVYI